MPLDLRRAFPGYAPPLILDVGANVGDFAAAMRRQFPDAPIVCVEPVVATAERLRRRHGRDSRISIVRVALGARPGQGHMVLAGSADMHYLERAGIDAAGRESPGPTEKVDVTTLDALCDEQGIKHVGYLKIDTEGGDLDVLRGAAGLFDAQRVDLVEVEAGMNPFNRRHVPFETLKAWLEAHRYFAFALYEQVPEWPSGAPHLRRVNVVFASEAMIRRHAKRDPFGVTL
jgi:FkbM family methyltransferase